MWNPLILQLVAATFITLPADTPDELDTKIVHALDFSRQQFIRTVNSSGDSLLYFRASGPAGEWSTVPTEDWTSGFFPGCLWKTYEWSEEKLFRSAAERWTAGLESQKFNNRTHDIGFMTFCSFGNGYRLTGNSHYKEVLLQAAQTLATRFNPKIGCIKSWESGKEWAYPVIIDNMMNLELLFWASKNGGPAPLREIALSHAQKTMNTHVRSDGGTYHVVDYDTATGEITKKQTHQGYSDESVWARGQAWAVYGFTMTFRETGEARFLATARKVADFFVDRLPPDGVPYWDFYAPGIPDVQRDASAAAIASSALIELSTLETDAPRQAKYLSAARRILATLCSPAYLAEGTGSAGILNHAVGNMPRNGEVDVSLIYADYYFLDAMLRFRGLQSYRAGE